MNPLTNRNVPTQNAGGGGAGWETVDGEGDHKSRLYKTGFPAILC
jgi:hypothetical protein